MDKEKKYFEINRKLWNERTAIHVESAFYDVNSFLEGKCSLNSIEKKELSKWAANEVLHLQCHFGQDSLSLARLGAKVTGIDISDNSILKARQLNTQLALNCTFIRGNIYDTRKLTDKKFDRVFTSYGAICWLPDLQKWASIISKSLKPNGIFYMVEFHPFLYTFDFPSKQLKYNYFNEKPYIEKHENTYTDSDQKINADEVFWIHSLSEVMSSLLHEDLEILHFKEYDYSPYNCFENMKKRNDSEYIFDIGIRIPHLFEIKARKR